MDTVSLVQHSRSHIATGLRGEVSGMTDRELRRRCQEKIETLHIPQPFSIDQVRAELEHERERALRSAPADASPGTPCGLWIALAEGDDGVSEQETTPLRQLHIIGHETGHLLLGHHGTYVSGDQLMGLLLPEVDPALLPDVPGCTVYTDDEEHEAEIFAALLLERITPRQAEATPPEQAQLTGRVEGVTGPGRLMSGAGPAPPR
jgi:hypothetical protein